MSELEDTSKYSWKLRDKFIILIKAFLKPTYVFSVIGTFQELYEDPPSTCRVV